MMSLPTSPAEHRTSDAILIDLLRREAARHDGGGDGLSVGELACRLGVTATAVRQRLERLMRADLVGRATVAPGISAGGQSRGGRSRGRPSHLYSLTEKGRRTGGDNFRDLAIVLWRELRAVRDPDVRQGLISRIGSAMAGLYRDEVFGDSPRKRLESTVKLLRDRRISCDVEASTDAPASLPVLTSYACPYPELAEQDRGICVAERLMLQDLVGSPVQLTDCRLDGGPCCRFTVAGDGAPAGEKGDRLPASSTCIKRD